MGFQKQVYTSVAPAVAGDPATPDQAVYTPVNFIAEGSVTVGNFAFAGTNAGQAKSTGSTILGIVQRNLGYFNYNLTSAGTLQVPDGSALQIAVRGDFWVKTLTAATVGQAVFVSTTDGSVKTAASGSSVSGSVETTWRVKTAGAANDLIIISNWEDQIGSSSADITSIVNAAVSAATINATQINGTVSVENGGTGLNTLGTAGQVLKVNSGATALEYANDATE